MSFLSSSQSSFFSPQDWDEIIFQKRMRRLEKRQNEMAYEISNDKKKSFELLKWLQSRVLFCNKCNVQFYSAEGLVNHRCEK